MHYANGPASSSSVGSLCGVVLCTPAGPTTPVADRTPVPWSGGAARRSYLAARVRRAAHGIGCPHVAHRAARPSIRTPGRVRPCASRIAWSSVISGEAGWVASIDSSSSREAMRRPISPTRRSMASIQPRLRRLRRLDEIVRVQPFSGSSRGCSVTNSSASVALPANGGVARVVSAPLPTNRRRRRSVASCVEGP
jgi:hypothetical protein